MMATWKLSPALAAGCSVVLKPDEADAADGAPDGRARRRGRLPAGHDQRRPRPGPPTGSYLVQHPGVDKIAFTGSTATGAEIMKSAADGIKRLTLELGGKSPNLVFADADLASAIPSSVWSIYYSAGQSCEARSRVLVEQSIYDDFVAQFSEAAGRLKVGDPLDPETQMGSLISTKRTATVCTASSRRAAEEGAEVVQGGEPARRQGRVLPADRPRRGRHTR